MDTDSFLLGRTEHFPGFSSVESEGLFAENVLACRNGVETVLLVERVRGADVDMKKVRQL